MSDFDTRAPLYADDDKLPAPLVAPSSSHSDSALTDGVPLWRPDGPAPLQPGPMPGLFTSAGVEPRALSQSEARDSSSPGLLERLGAAPAAFEGWAMSHLFSQPNVAPNADEQKLLAKGGQFTGDSSPTYLQSSSDAKASGLPPLGEAIHDFADHAIDRTKLYEDKGLPFPVAGALGTVHGGIDSTVGDMRAHVQASSDDLEEAFEDPAPADKLVDGGKALLHLGAGALDAYSIADPIARLTDAMPPVSGVADTVAATATESAGENAGASRLDSALESRRVDGESGGVDVPQGDDVQTKSEPSIDRSQPPARGAHLETTDSKPVKTQDATDQWDSFLGEGLHSDTHPRTGAKDPDRIVSADGKRSIRYGDHEMQSSPTKHHYHEETWNYDEENHTMNVDNVVKRVPLPKKK